MTFKVRLKSKYGSKKTILDGIVFDSIAEAARYSELKFLEISGEIKELKIKPKFTFTHNDTKICSYIADFSYSSIDGEDIVEDVKGVRTQVYRIKNKLMKAFYNIDILETK